jgi:hypothetical protein
MVVGKVPSIRSTWRHFRADRDSTRGPRCRRCRAGVDHGWRTVDLDVVGDALDILVADVQERLARGIRCEQATGMRSQVGDGVARQGFAADHDLKPL